MILKLLKDKKKDTIIFNIYDDLFNNIILLETRVQAAV